MARSKSLTHKSPRQTWNNRGVQALFRPEFLVEVDAVAVVNR